MASGSIAAFSPEATVSVTASTTSSAVTLGGTGPSLLVYNSSSDTAFMVLGANRTLTATAAALPVPAGSQVLLGIGATVNAAAVILQTGTGTVFLTRGSGSFY
jgi:hypothetical protein